MSSWQLMFAFTWLGVVATCVVAGLVQARRRFRSRRAVKRERLFVELRQMGYEICDINPSGTRAKLGYMEPQKEVWVWEWVDILDLGHGYGLTSPISKKRD